MCFFTLASYFTDLKRLWSALLSNGVGHSRLPDCDECNWFLSEMLSGNSIVVSFA